MTTTGTTPTDPVTVLQLCRDIEMYCAQIYHEYESRYADDEELRSLWHKTAIEEENHMRTFVMVINMRREHMVIDTHVDPVKAEQILGMLKGIYNKIQEHPPTPIDALRSAIKLEENLSKFHLEAVADFQDEGLKKMFHAMMMADDKHIQAVERLYHERLKKGASVH